MHHRGIIITPQKRPSRAAGVLSIMGALVLATVLAASAAGAPSRTTLRVGATHNRQLRETILVNAGGRTLYHLRPESAHHIICTGACAKLWPPLLVRSRGTRLLAASGVHGRLSIIRRPGATLQVAFNGQPLYMFARDHRPGDVKGQGFGGVWFVLVQPAARHAAPGGIPQQNGGDMDGDNNGAPSDGDGNR